MNWPALILVATMALLCAWVLWDTHRITKRRDQGPLRRNVWVTDRRLAKRNEDDTRLALYGKKR